MNLINHSTHWRTQNFNMNLYKSFDDEILSLSLYIRMTYVLLQI